MLSRVADNLYWFGRYLQRAENTARLITVSTNLMLDLPRRMTLGWGTLIDIVGSKERFQSLYDQATEENVVRYLMTDERNAASIRSSLHTAREILRTVRDSMPRETWERINDIYFYVLEHSETAIPRAPRQAFLQQSVSGTLLTYSVLTSNMSRDVGFKFLQIGVNIEQADMTTRILDVRTYSLLGVRPGAELSPFESIQWMSVLRSLTAYQMFRRHVRTRVNGPGVLRFLLQNREFPRSVMFCLSTIADSLPALPSNRKIERAIERTRGLVRDANVEVMVAEAGALAALMDEIQIGLGGLHEALVETYFRSGG